MLRHFVNGSRWHRLPITITITITSARTEAGQGTESHQLSHFIDLPDTNTHIEIQGSTYRACLSGGER
jgi:hypothetical protein